MKRSPEREEYDRLFDQLSELSHTQGVDGPEYEKLAARLDELAAKLGIAEDIGDPDED
jgi:hypothetical protein